MSTEKIRGLIIKETFSGEADKYLTIFAKDKGKISVFAKGARNTKSKFLAASSIFTYADFIIRTATKTPTLISADIIETFYNLRTCLAATAYGSYMAELLDKAFIDNVADNDALQLALKTLQWLSKGDDFAREKGCIFQLRLLEILGYRPDEQLLGEFSLSKDAKNIINYILTSDLNSAFRLNINTTALQELEVFIEKYMEYHTDIRAKSYKLIKTMVLTNK